jgi:hypothetical protein
MTFPITKTTKALSTQTNIQPNLALKIEGIDYIFGSIHVETISKFDEGLFFDDGLFFDLLIPDPDSRDWISFESPTTKNLSQQLLQDKGGTSSISGFIVKIINKDNALNTIFQSGNLVADVLSKQAKLYLGFKGSRFPDDYIKIFAGIIDDFGMDAGSAILSIAHPERLKKAELFLEFKTESTSFVTGVATTIPVIETTNFIESDSNGITSYIKIDDEIMLVNSLTSNSFNVTRGQLGTTAIPHDNNSEVSSYYKLEGYPIDVALKLMLSSGDDSFFGVGISAVSFNQLNGLTYKQNSFYVPSEYLLEDYSLRRNDLVKIEGSTTNDGTYTIKAIDEFDEGYCITVYENINTSTTESASVTFRSQYNVLNHGLAMLPDQVDIDGHLEMSTLFGSSFPYYEFYIKETIDNAKDFIDKEIYFPSGMYSVPRKASSSVKMTAPPLAQFETKTFNTVSVVNADKVKIKRSMNKNFYNAVIWKFEDDVLEDKFLNGQIVYSASSANRIKSPNRALKIEAKGLRNNTNTLGHITRQSERFIERYQFAAEYIEGLEVLFRDGWNLEVGDTIIFGGADLQLVDTETGERNYRERLMEIVNKSIDIQTGKTVIDLLSTAFSLDGRYGVISPSSYITSDSTDSRVVLQTSFDTGEYVSERDKWIDFLGQNIRVRSVDYSYDHTTKFIGLDNANSNGLLLSPALPSTPPIGALIEVPEYDDSSVFAQQKYKLMFCYYNPQLEITASYGNEIEFDTDATKLYIDAIVRIHNDDFSLDSIEVRVETILGNKVTLSENVGFTIQSGHFVELVGFLDLGKPYRIF